MTTATTQPTLPHRSSFARVPAVFRLQFAVRYSFIWLPIAIFVLAWAFGYGVLTLVDSQIPDRIPAQEPLHATGAAQATIWYLAFMAGYTGSHTFPFSLALSYSRRVYLMGTYLTFLVVALGYGVAAMLAYLVERATNGLGNHMYIFGAPSFEDAGGTVGVGVVAAVVALFFMCFGFFWAILYRRVTIPILWTVIIGVVIVILGVLALITTNQWWSHVGMWINEQNAFTLAGYGFLATTVLGVLNYILIRKATAN